MVVWDFPIITPLLVVQLWIVAIVKENFIIFHKKGKGKVNTKGKDRYHKRFSFFPEGFPKS